MSEDIKKNEENQEIDLLQISKSIGNGFQNLAFSLFKGIQFLVKNSIIIAILFVIGLGIGLYLDSSEKKYNHQIIVIPNFQSNDYLYSKIDLINAKIEDKDTLFLKALGFSNPKSISKIEIEPIIDAYTFVRYNEDNFDLLKLIAENNDIDKVLKDKVTSKNYPYHLISFSTKGKITNENTIDPLLKALNDNAYFRVIQKNIIENVKIKIQSNDNTLVQIDGILNSFSNSADNKSVKNDNLIYYNNNNQLNEVLKTKYELISEQGNRKIELINYQKIIKEVSVTANIKNVTSINGKLKLVLPFLFISLFILLRLFLSFYKTQSVRFKNSQQ